MMSEELISDAQLNIKNSKTEIKKSILPISFQTVIEQIILNLKVMGDIKHGDKLSTISENVEIDQYSYARFLYRRYYGDSRVKTLEKLKDIIEDTEKITNSLLLLEKFDDNFVNLPENNSKLLQDLIPDMSNASRGLHCLKLTYSKHVLTENKLDMLIKKLGDQIDKIKGMMKIELTNDNFYSD